MIDDKMPLLVRDIHHHVTAPYWVETPERRLTWRFARKYKRDQRAWRSQVFDHMQDAGEDRNAVFASTGSIGLHLRGRPDVDRYLRRLRPQEAEGLADVDRRIANLEAALKQARQERQDFLAEAWRKGHAVTFKELLEEAERSAAAKQETTV